MSIKISLQNISKKYNRHIIFNDVNIEIFNKEKIVVLGANGSGKSTLLQIIAGYVTPSNGAVIYSNTEVEISREEIYKYISIASPSIELIEEFTLLENVDFYTQLKPLKNNLSPLQIAELCYLENSKNKPLNQYSSGMKQRLKLALTITADVPLLLLDEPTMNLDKQGINWYKNLITTYAIDKTCIVCSNQINDEYFFCSKEINIDNYK